MQATAQPTPTGVQVVADVGNSRLKWGRCEPGRIVEMVSLPLDDEAAWELQVRRWGLTPDCRWGVAGVYPQAQDRFVRWLHQCGAAVEVVDDYRRLPLHVAVEEPHRVGMDRLLNAVAAHCLAYPDAAVIVAVGTAMTVDWVDAHGVFQGGAIVPGPQLMADALHRRTAQLPYVEVGEVPPVVAPATNTAAAILAGTRAAVAGAALLLAHRYAELSDRPWVFLTGGALGDLARWNFGDRFRGTRHVPTLTLDGLRITTDCPADRSVSAMLPRGS